MLYKINTDETEASTRVELSWPANFDLTEKDIENFLKSRLHEVISEEQLMLIGQERSWQEEADLLALDKDGLLYIFELKRWESKQENILQVMRYAQIFGRYSYEELTKLVQKQQKLDSSLKQKHKDYFGLDKELSDSDFNKDQVLVLVTNGTDKDTISAVNFWSKKGVKIKCSPYRIYNIDRSPYIQFDTYNPDDEVIPDEEENNEFFIVNTNKTWEPDAWKDMINDSSTGKASAYYGRKNSICRISKGDTVYLYHTSVGIIAKGIATSTYKKTDWGSDKDEEFFVELKFSWVIDEKEWDTKTPRAWEMNKKWNYSHRFRPTVLSITQDMANGIDDIAKEKGVISLN